MVEFSLKSKTNSEETFDATEELGNMNKNNGAGTSGDNNNKKKKSLEQATEIQNPLKNLVQGLNHELQLSRSFFLDDNFDCGQQQQQQQHFIPKKQYVDVPHVEKKI